MVTFYWILHSSHLSRDGGQKCPLNWFLSRLKLFGISGVDQEWNPKVVNKGFFAKRDIFLAMKQWTHVGFILWLKKRWDLVSSPIFPLRFEPNRSCRSNLSDFSKDFFKPCVNADYDPLGWTPIEGIPPLGPYLWCR